MGGNVDEMRKPELMKYAASLGVATRRQGMKTWRLLKDVRADCKMREAAEQQRLLADAGGPGSVSPSQAAPPAPSTAEQSGQAASLARTRAEQPGQAALPAPSMLSVPEPGSASSSTGVPTQAAPVAGIGTRDLENMKKKDLRKVAVAAASGPGPIQAAVEAAMYC